MITVERTVLVDRPVSAVFAYLSDFTHTEQWDPGTVSTRRTDSGPLAAGSTYANVSEFRGNRTELTYVCRRFELDAHLVFVGNNKTVQATDDLAFTARGTSTEIRYQARFEFKKLYRLAEPFLRKSFEPIADETAEQLKSTLEREI